MTTKQMKKMQHELKMQFDFDLPNDFACLDRQRYAKGMTAQQKVFQRFRDNLKKQCDFDLPEDFTYKHHRPPVYSEEDRVLKRESMARARAHRYKQLPPPEEHEQVEFDEHEDVAEEDIDLDDQ